MTARPVDPESRRRTLYAAVALVLVMAAVVLAAGCIGWFGSNDNVVADNVTESHPKINEGEVVDFSRYTTKSPTRRGNQVLIVDFHDFLGKWNEKLHWGFSPGQIEQFNQSLVNGLLKKYQERADYLTYDIPDIKPFCLEIGDAIGLTREQSDAFAVAADEDLRKSKADSHLPSPTLATHNDSKNTNEIHPLISSSPLSVNDTTVEESSFHPK
jgi:hypothetical protein